MAYGDYYNPANKVVNSGDIVYADDLNSINTAVDAGFTQVAADLDIIALGDANVSKAWATNDRGVRPDVLLDQYSSKANALEAQDWAVAVGTITEAKTGLPLAGSKSAKAYASEASISASSASGFASTATTQAGTATTQAGIATTQAGLASGYKDTATTQAGIATTKATEAQDWASKTVDVVVSGGLYSARHYATKANDTVASMVASVSSLAALTPAADKIPYYTGTSTAALATFTAAGRALLDDVDATAQRATLGLSNVPNLDCTNGNNIISGTVADARIASTISRNNAVGTAVQTALNLKANLSSPTFTGTPTLTNTPSTNDNTTKLASTAFVVGQRGVNNPYMNGVVSVGTSFLYAREDHIHPSDTSKLNKAGGTIDGDLYIVRPEATGTGAVYFGNTGTRFLYYNGSSYELPSANLVINGGQALTSTNSKTAGGSSLLGTGDIFSNAVLTGVPTAPTAAVGTNTTQIATAALVFNTALGYNQTWQSVTRNSGQTYYNLTGRTIVLIVRASTISAVIINGVSMPTSSGNPGTYIIPPGASYSVTLSDNINLKELR